MVDEETGNPCVIIVAFPDATFINTKITFRYVEKCLTMLNTNVTLHNRIDKIGSDAKLWRRAGGGGAWGIRLGFCSEIFFRSVPCRVAIERRKGISF